ncbi:hypothetical protein KIN20_004490 [Parelaphostrongylus tenuis]|uniref:Uncharacterized protein n=1 Tax=Parelaphostrongylus tenuis TaxID=148309 RepID=A0AAD5MRF3_PARTN|nr:hypothetical protein KIN20_004490 [Parelaphostrongylus tenuis]
MNTVEYSSGDPAIPKAEAFHTAFVALIAGGYLGDVSYLEEILSHLCNPEVYTSIAKHRWGQMNTEKNRRQMDENYSVDFTTIYASSRTTTYKLGGRIR